jgi:hypothetical protein
MRANQGVEFLVFFQVGDDERTDWNDGDLVISGKLKCRPREPRGDASMTKGRRNFSVVEHQAACSVVVIPEHCGPFGKPSLEAICLRVVLDRDDTIASSFDVVHRYSASLYPTLLHECPSDRSVEPGSAGAMARNLTMRHQPPTLEA